MTQEDAVVLPSGDSETTALPASPKGDAVYGPIASPGSMPQTSLRFSQPR
jgi:hypothetical protein